MNERQWEGQKEGDTLPENPGVKALSGPEPLQQSWILPNFSLPKALSSQLELEPPSTLLQQPENWSWSGVVLLVSQWAEPAGRDRRELQEGWSRGREDCCTHGISPRLCHS